MVTRRSQSRTRQRARRDTVEGYRRAFEHRNRVAELDALVDRLWPAGSSLELDGWRLRSGRGLPWWVHSVWPRACGDRVPLRVRLEGVERYYRQTGAPARVLITPGAKPAGLDAALAERGYLRRPPLEVRAAALPSPVPAAPAGDESDDVEVAWSDAPDEAWLATLAEATGLSAGQAQAAGRVRARVEATSWFGRLRLGGRDVAVVRGVVHGGWLGIADLATVADARGRGAARRLLELLVRGAVRVGAEQGWAAVPTDEPSAGALARRFGLAPAYRIHVREQPASTVSPRAGGRSR